MSTERDLYEQTADAFAALRSTTDAAALVASVAAAYPAMAERPATTEDAETCRLTMLGALQSPDHADQAFVWRARSLSRATVVGWTECVAALAMGEAFSHLAAVNDGFAAGRTLDVLRAAPHAVAALAELAVYLEAPESGIRLGPQSPRQATVRRFLHEKSGFLQLVAGDLDDARTSYGLAARAVEGDARGEAKVALGAALVDYVVDPSTGAEPTRTLLARAEAGGWADLTAVAEHNLRVMESGGRALLGYEIL